MSFIATASVWKMTENITSSEKFVLLVLANRVNQETGQCFPSLNTIARETCLTQRGVQKIIKSLEQKNLITVERSKQANGKNAPNQYALNFEFTTTEGRTQFPKVENTVPQHREHSSLYGREHSSPEPKLNLKNNKDSLAKDANGKSKSKAKSNYLPWHPDELYNIAQGYGISTIGLTTAELRDKIKRCQQESN